MTRKNNKGDNFRGHEPSVVEKAKNNKRKIPLTIQAAIIGGIFVVIAALITKNPGVNIEPSTLTSITTTNTTNPTIATTPTPHYDLTGDIAYYSKVSIHSDSHVVILNLDKPTTTELSITSHMEEFPSWSTYGSFLVYGSDETGKSQIYKMNSSGDRSITQITKNVYNDWDSVVSPGDKF